MGRHSLPEDSVGPVHSPRQDPTGSRSSARRRAVAISTAVVLALATGAALVLRSELLGPMKSCSNDAVRLGVAASPDIAPALREVAERARSTHVRSDGRCLDVKVTSRVPYEVAAALGDDSRDPGFQVWLPDSSVWVDRATSSPAKSVPLDTLGGVASSPVAVAATPSAAKRLGWPQKKYSWARLTGAATGDEDLRLGSADPARSATGLLALARVNASIAKESGGPGKGGGADTRAAAAAKLLSQRVSDSDDQVLTTLPRDDSGAEAGNPRRNQALFLSEQAAYRHNAAAGGAPRLQLFYPEDGTAELDYPYTVLNDDALTTVRARVATRFMTFLSDTQNRRILARHGFRPAGGKAVEEVTRTAGGKAPQPYAVVPASGPSGAELETALGMWTITVQSARLNTVVDASASMAAPVPGRGGESRMAVTKASLLRALAQFTPDDEIGLWEFSRQLDGARDYRELVPTRRLGLRDADGSTQRDRLTAAFGALEPVPGGATGLYDTALAAYRKARDGYAQGKFNAVVLLTDGSNQDEGSISRKALVEELSRLTDPNRPVPLIAIAVGPDADLSACKDIAEATGGSAQRVADPAQIDSVILKAIVSASRAGTEDSG
ncbi:substrate-binding domain-containing protein [Streptomyces milbemycinicus]|uniref:Substrate-binding domain-containing protein n=1 Tax=Streptomyces milbemycinicus TaxID=476552 RepID=A0ABW8LJS7_9ACTN